MNEKGNTIKKKKKNKQKEVINNKFSDEFFPFFLLTTPYAVHKLARMQHK